MGLRFVAIRVEIERAIVPFLAIEELEDATLQRQSPHPGVVYVYLAFIRPGTLLKAYGAECQARLLP